MKKLPLPTESLPVINPEQQPLTKEKLLELSGLPLNEEQAQATVHAIHQFAKLLYDTARLQRCA